MLIESIPFGQEQMIGDARVSFHPAGHILGSAQIRIEVGGYVWVVSGDYKPQSDKTCETFELVPCHGFISECTFGLPVYQVATGSEIHQSNKSLVGKIKNADKGSSVICIFSG